MKINKNLAKVLSLGILLTNVPINSFANDVDLNNKYSNEIKNIKTKEDLQKSAQKAVKSGEVDTWIEGFTNMPTARTGFSSLVLNDKIYCIGGYTGSAWLNKVEVYDPITDTWETKANMPKSIDNFGSAVVDGKIYCIGGYSRALGYLKVVQVYDPDNDTWDTSRAIMPTARSEFSSVVVDDKIYCIGGYNGISNLNKVEVYNTKTDSWETKTDMPTGRRGMGSVIINNKIYCIGGNNGSSYLNNIEIYDTTIDTWNTSKANMPTTRGYFGCVALENKIYCIGGYSGSSYLKKLEVYDINTETWETKTDMPTARYDFGSIVLNEKIYCIGGWDGNSRLNTLDIYTVKLSLEDEIKSSVSKAEESKDPVDIEDARDKVNKLEEGELKTELQDRLDAIVPSITLSSNSATTNVDIYIKSENSLVMILDSNSITFDGFSSAEDIVKHNAITVTIKSSLPYELNSYLVQEITNLDDESKTLDKSILNIKANGTDTYNTFEDIGTTPILLLENQSPTETNEHGIDFMLDADIPYENGNYKTVIKFEAKQK